MKKIIAADYDGTLNQGGIHPHVAEAIARFRAAGNLFGVVTGRDVAGSYGVFAGEGKFSFDFVLPFNGALALDAAGNVLYNASIRGDQPFGDTTLAKALVRRVWALTGFHCGIAFADRRMDIHPDYPDGGKIRWTTLTPFGDLERDVFGQMGEFCQLNTICEDEKRAGEVTAILQAEFGAYVNPLQNGICIDIPVKGMDKGEAVARYAALMGVREEDCWTAGDNYNDLAMLERFHGCAMANGVQAAKDAAEFVCGDIADVVDIVMGE
ncbi:MAG: HAD hydrolase family protein [Clostridia bacterium]|nr:HAD hydrolase family protein [Clostridia bacterium]